MSGSDSRHCLVCFSRQSQYRTPYCVCPRSRSPSNRLRVAAFLLQCSCDASESVRKTLDRESRQREMGGIVAALTEDQSQLACAAVMVLACLSRAHPLDAARNQSIATIPDRSLCLYAYLRDHSVPLLSHAQALISAESA